MVCAGPEMSVVISKYNSHFEFYLRKTGSEKSGDYHDVIISKKNSFLKMFLSILKFLPFKERFRKAAFSWWISVDGRPNCSNKAIKVKRSERRKPAWLKQLWCWCFTRCKVGLAWFLLTTERRIINLLKRSSSNDYGDAEDNILKKIHLNFTKVSISKGIALEARFRSCRGISRLDLFSSPIGLITFSS